MHFLFLCFLMIEQNNADEQKCIPSCPENWEKEEDRCYLWPSHKRSWREAEQFCKEEGGHLASVTNQRIHDYIWSKVDQRNKKTHFWIGGTDQAKEGTWTWTDGSLWNFTKWGTTPKRQPDNYNWDWDLFEDEDCLQIYHRRSTDGWNDKECSSEKKFVCSRPICPNLNITSTNNSDVSDNSDSGGNTTTTITNKSNKKTTPSMTLIAGAASSGIFLVASTVVVIVCIVNKRPNPKRENARTNVDENPVYAIYQLDDAYERQYSTNEAVDNNLYYE